MINRVIGMCLLVFGTSTASGFDAVETEIVQLDRLDVMQIIYSPSTGSAKVVHLRGACPPETVSHSDSDFGAGQYVVQAGFAQGEAAAQSWTLPLDRFPLRFDSAEILFATSNATQATTTEWGVEIFEGTPTNGSLLASFQSDDVILPHLTMPPGTSGTIIQFLIDPDDPDQIYISDNGTHAYTVAFRVIAHNTPGSPCISSPPTSSNAFPTTDISGLASPSGNWIDMVTGAFCVCGVNWNTFQQLPSICTPSGDWVLRSTYTPFGCAAASGACCLPDGSCETTTEDACLLDGGSYEGDNTDCGSINCPQPIGACCVADSGNCIDSEAEICFAFGGIWNYGETCDDFICFPEGACCLLDGSCVDNMNPEDCTAAGGIFRGDGTLCDTEDCPAPLGWCCTATGDCFNIEEADCLAFGGLWGTPGSTCDDPDACEEDNPCPEDIDGSGDVNVDDALAILSDWGSLDGGSSDVTGDGVVDVNDLLAVIAAWGPC